MTPFEEAGYTKETKFRVLSDSWDIKEGDIVTLHKDDGSVCPIFKTEDGREGPSYLPSMEHECYEELEVYEEPNKELTPFEAAGYTKETRFRVLRDYWNFKQGDIVTLDEDDGNYCPSFKTEDGRCGSMWLPNMAPKGCREELEVCEEPNTKNDIDCELSTIITSLKFKISEIEDIVGSLQKLKDNS